MKKALRHIAKTRRYVAKALRYMEKACRHVSDRLPYALEDGREWIFFARLSRAFANLGSGRVISLQSSFLAS
jgi:hypothetical protein